MSQSDQMTQQDQQADRTNKIVTSLVGCVLLGIGGVIAFQNVDGIKSLTVPDRNKLWADAWKKKLSNHWEMPKAEPVIDWSDPKNDPNKIAERMMQSQSPLQRELNRQAFGRR